MIDRTINSFHPSRSTIPNHVGIIPDGSRRWARQAGVSLYESYVHAMRLLTEIIAFLFEAGVRIVSVYFSSSQNFERPEQEVDSFCRAETFFCKEFFPAVANRYRVRVKFCGDQSLVPQFLVDALKNLVEGTRKFSGNELNICVAYNPIDELWDSMNRSSTPAEFINNLRITTPVDLIIRTGKANLISNFLPLQSGFARLYFPDKLFNELKLDDIAEIIDTFKEIERRYGE